MIANVIERGDYAYVYNENNKQIGTIMTSSKTGEGLKGYTNNRINIKRGNIIYTYNENLHQISTCYAG